MADVNISDLPPILSATNDDVIIINDGDVTTSKITWANLVNSITDFTGQTSFDPGTESAPSISFTGDSNCGIYRPATTDKLGFVTNGSTRLYIDDSGRIGIGNTTPEDYSVISNNLVIGDDISGDNGITIATGTDDIGTLVFADGTDTTSETAGRLVYDHNDDHLHFEVNSEEAMRITEDGFVGIGTSQPVQLLHVSSGDSGVTNLVPGIFGPVVEALSTQNAGLIFQTASNRTAGFYFSDPANTQAGSVVFSHSSDLMSFNIDSVERIGIGASSTVFKDSSANQTAIITDDGRFRVGQGTPTTGLLSITGNITGSPDEVAVDISGAVQSDVTDSATSYLGSTDTQAAAFTLANAYHFKSQGGTVGAGSFITNQYGFHVSSLGNATNNYGFYSDISTTGDYQFYSSGTSPNYFDGSTHTFANGGTNVLQMTGGTANFFNAVSFSDISVSGTATIGTGSFTQVNSADIDFTGSIEGPSATIATIGATSVTAGLFTGNLTGDVTGDLTGNADTADRVYVTASNNNVNYLISFNGAGGDYRDIYVDNDLTYNPSTNILTVNRLDATTINSTNITATDVNITGDLTIPGGITGNVTGESMTVNDLTVNDDLTVSDVATFDGVVSFNSTVNGNFTGNLIGNADTATAVSTSIDTSNAERYLFFGSSATGNQSISTATTLRFNPSSNVISADINGDVTGDVTGNADSATNATNIDIDDDTTGTGSKFLLFSDNGSGINRPKSDSNLRFSPSTNTLSTTTFEGDLIGNADSASSISTSSNSSSSNQYVLFANASSGNQALRTDGGIRYNPSTNILTTNVTGNLTGNVTGNSDTSTTATNASNITLADESSDTDCYPVFAKGAAGNQSPKTGTNLRFDSSTGRLSATSFSGIGSSLNSLNASNISSGTISDDRLPGTISSNITGSSASCTGNAATATRATDSNRVNVTATGANTNYRVVFTEASNTTDTTGNIYKDTATNFYYNPSTNTLTTTTFSGSLSGNASSASNASLLDNLDSTQFLRSDTTDTKTSGYLRFNDSVNLAFGNQEDVELFFNGSNMYMDLNLGNFYIRDGSTTRFTFSDSGNLSVTATVTANAFTGIGTNLTSLNASNISSGTISDSRLPATITSNITGSSASCTGNAATASNASLLDNINSTQFLRSDTTDQKTSGTLQFNDGVILALGSSADAEFFKSGSGLYLDLNSAIGNFYIRDGTTTRFTFDDNGTFTSTGDINSSSDIRLKENLEVIENSIEKVQQLSGYTYDRTDVELHQAGVIAQEVENVLPEAVSEDEEGIKSVAYNQLIPLLIEAIKDQQKQIDELKSKLG